MATDNSDTFSCVCSKCSKRLKVPAKLRGSRAKCPACGASMVLDDSSLEPEFQLQQLPPTMVDTPAAKADNDLDEFGFQLAPEVPTSTRPTEDELLKQHLDTGSQATLPTKDEFRYSCKVCGTSMYSRASEIGKMVRCPDCYSEFSVPRPAPEKKRPSGPAYDSLEEVALSPVITKSKPATREFGRSSADEYLARAAIEAEEDREKEADLGIDFDTSSWLRRIFSFLADPTLLVVAIATGIGFGCVLILGGIAYRLAEPRGLEASRAFRGMVIAIAGIPLLMATLANGLAVLESAANRLRRVARWPIFTPFETISESFVVAAAFGFAAIPGGILSWLMSYYGFEPAIGFIVVLVSAGLLFPIFLLGMLDNQSVGSPISSDVTRSMSMKGDAWGAMYLLSALALLGLFVVYLISRGGSNGSMFMFGLTIPFVAYFIFHQYGILASRISDVINLNLASDDESDEDSPTESDSK